MVTIFSLLTVFYSVIFLESFCPLDVLLAVLEFLRSHMHSNYRRRCLFVKKFLELCTTKQLHRQATFFLVS